MSQRPISARIKEEDYNFMKENGISLLRVIKEGLKRFKRKCPHCGRKYEG